jgi:hypothetical protein
MKTKHSRIVKTSLFFVVCYAFVSPLFAMMWQTETVESAGRVGACPDIAADETDRPHIVYQYDPSTGADSLRYAIKGTSGWTVETVAGSNFGLYNSILLDNGIHIASSNTTTTLHYITPGTSGWDFQQVNGILYNVDATRITRHPNGGIYIMYRHNVPNVGGRISISNNATGSWQAATLPSSGMSQYVDMAIGTDGVIHIVFAYYDSSISTGGIKYCRSDTGWTEESVMTSGSNSSVGVSVGLDSANQPHIINRVGNTNAVYYCCLNNGFWNASPIGSVYGSSGGCKVVMDIHDRPCAVVSQSFVATNGSDWRIRAIAGMQRDGRMVMDGSGNLHLCSYNLSAYDLIYTKGTPIVLEQIPNGDFENGETDWYDWGEGGSEGILQYAADVFEFPESSGNHVARIRAFDPWDNGSAGHSLSVRMDLPTEGDVLYLAFDYQFLCSDSTVDISLSTLSSPLIQLTSPVQPMTQMQQVVIPVPWEALDMQEAVLNVYLDVQNTNSSQTEGYGFYLDNARFLQNLPGDITGEGRVDLADFAVLSANWQRTDCEACNGADLSGDSAVTTADMEILIQYWLAGT